MDQKSDRHKTRREQSTKDIRDATWSMGWRIVNTLLASMAASIKAEFKEQQKGRDDKIAKLEIKMQMLEGNWKSWKRIDDGEQNSRWICLRVW